MSQNDPITINSWTLGDQCAFEEPPMLPASRASASGRRPMWTP